MLKIHAPAIRDLSDLRTALQNAIKLEHATIPPYLTALYTLEGTSESVGYARNVIRSIVVEEMLHMTLASNVLNAVGGSPAIDDPDFIPSYPGPLPMGIGDGLQVGIMRYSGKLVTEVFMEIEEPEEPLDLPTTGRVAAAAITDHYETIGEFYDAIKATIEKLGDSIFTGSHDKQITGWFAPDEIVKVVGVETAKAAIETIVTQGEGTKKLPIDDFGQLAHFYEFEELSKGMKIVPDPTSEYKYAFSSAPENKIEIDDATDVIAMVDNPPLIDFSGNWRAQQLSDEFDFIYSKLLKALHIAFNGKPDTMGNAIGAMFELKNAAGELLRVELSDGLFAGPKYKFANV